MTLALTLPYPHVRIASAFCRARSSMAEQWPFKPLVESSNLSALTCPLGPPLSGGYLILRVIRGGTCCRIVESIARSLERLSSANDSVRPKASRITVTKKKSASSTGSVPIRMRVDWYGLIAQMPAPNATESASERYRPSGMITLPISRR